VGKIVGKNGTWDADVTPGNPDEISITFTPKAGTCKNIRLAQTAQLKAFDATPAEVPGPPEDWWTTPYPFGHTRTHRVRDAAGRFVWIDHQPCEGDPFYNGDDRPHDGTSRGDATTTPPTGTTMTDAPSVSYENKIANVKQIVATFETCAICVDTGEILGCISWSSTSTPTDKGTIRVEPPDKEVDCSDSFKKAMKKFVETHTKTDAGGTLRWWCPETGGSIKGPTGSTTDPFGGAVPPGFKTAWLATEPRPLRIDRERTGGGRRLKTVDEAIGLAAEEPQRAAVKFTWAGEQIKTVAGLVLTAYADISGEDVAPHVGDDPRFANDFSRLEAYVVSADVVLELVSQLGSVSRLLRNRDAPAIVTIISGLGSARAASLTGTLTPSQVSALAERVASHPATDEGALQALSYLALNMGPPC
jgi:hypothetical protein